MPVVCNDRCRMVDDVAQFIDGYVRPCDHAATFSCDSGSATDSVHRGSWWTFQLATETGTWLSAVAVMAAMMGFWAVFPLFLALLQVVPELNASFRSPRWRRVPCHRGPFCTIYGTLLTYDICSLMVASETTTIIQSGEAPFQQARSLHPTLGS